MRFTISPCTSKGDTVFLIYDEAGEVRYRVTRSKKARRRRTAAY